MAPPASILKKLKPAQKNEVESLAIPELKKRLQANDQVTGGTKSELILRIADAVVNGCLPRCPKCSGGRVKQSASDSFFCPGYQDDDHFVRCSWSGGATDITRPAWKTAEGKDI